MSIGEAAKKIFCLTGAVAALALGGCGGGGASSPTASVSGVVADGYLERAKVFLDLNDDKIYTQGEPTATTDANGHYTLTGVSANDLKKHAIVVLAESGTTINHEGNVSTPVSEAYVLSTPPNAPRTAEGNVMITPLTTLIHSQMETNPALSVTTAEAAVKANLGVSANTSLFDDFVQKKGASDDYDKLSKVSQVVAAAIGNNMTAIKEAAPQANLNDVIKVIISEVISQLPAISTTVATTQNFNPATIASTVSVDTSDATTLQTTLAKAGTATAASSFQTALGTDGFFSINSQYDSDTTYYQYGVVKLGASGPNGYALTENDYIYTALNPTWTATSDTSNDFALTKEGWAASDDSASAGRLVFNSDGTATWTLIASGLSQKISVSKLDVAGKPIKMFLQDVPVNDEAVFPAGSEGYNMTFVPQSDNYRVWAGNNSQFTGISTLSQLVSTFAVGGQQSLYLGFNFSVRFAGSGQDSGTAQFYYQSDYMNPPKLMDLPGSWKIVQPVTGYPVLVLDVPFAYKAQYMSDDPGRGIIFAAVNQVVREGSVEYAGAPRTDKGMNFNKTAFDAIKSNFTPVWSTPVGAKRAPSTAKTARSAAKKFRML